VGITSGIKAVEIKSYLKTLMGLERLPSEHEVVGSIPSKGHW